MSGRLGCLGEGKGKGRGVRDVCGPPEGSVVYETFLS